MTVSVCWIARVDVVTDVPKLVKTIYDNPSLLAGEKLRVNVKRDIGYKKLVTLELVGTPIEGVWEGEMVLTPRGLKFESEGLKLSIIRHVAEVETLAVMVEAVIPEDMDGWRVPPLEFREKVSELTFWLADAIRETAFLV